MFRSRDGGQTWQELPGLRAPRGTSGSRAPAACACTRSFWTRPIRSASSSPSRLPAPSGPTTAARPGNRSTGLTSEQECRTRTPKLATASPHRHASIAARRALYAEALGRHAQRRRRRFWHEVSGNLPSDFGFPIAVHAHEPETIYVVPIKSDSEHYPPEGKLRVYRSRTGGNEWEALTEGLPQSDCYVNVLRDAMAVDSLDSVRHLLRHDGRAGLRLSRFRR